MKKRKIREKNILPGYDSKGETKNVNITPGIIGIED